MENLSFIELKLIASCLCNTLNLDSLIKDGDTPDSDFAKDLSERNYDGVHTLIVVLTELMKFRSLPF